MSIILSNALIFLGAILPLMIAKDLSYGFEFHDEASFKKLYPSILDGLKTKYRRYLWYYPLFFVKRFVIVFALIVLRGKHLTIDVLT